MTDLIPTIGLMAGTSVDGIDAALLFTNGEVIERSQHALTTAYDPATKAAIFNAFEQPHQDHQALSLRIAQDHARACEMLIAQSGITPQLIGFHGQTIFHDPAKKLSIQLGDGAYLANRLEVQLVYDFRQNDLAAGGQGAPLAPIYHASLLGHMKLGLPSAMVNIGGISNASIWDGVNLLGFDTGPGNALMDDAMRAFDGSEFDKNGEMASLGEPDHDLINEMIAHPYFKKRGAKSLDRLELREFVLNDDLAKLSHHDQMATLTYFTAKTIVGGIALNMPSPLKNLVMTGGGSLNSSLIKAIKAEAEKTIKGMAVSRMEDHGMDSRFIEAELMAFLAVRHLRGLPLTFPQTTGVDAPQTGGVMVLPQPK